MPFMTEGAEAAIQAAQKGRKATAKYVAIIVCAPTKSGVHFVHLLRQSLRNLLWFARAHKSSQIDYVKFLNGDLLTPREEEKL
jgi:hypothetical protein